MSPIKEIPRHFEPTPSDKLILSTKEAFWHSPIVLQETKEKLIVRGKIHEKIMLAKLISIVSFSVFLTISALSGALILLCALKNVTIIEPIYLIYGFLGSIGLAITIWKGILTWSR